MRRLALAVGLWLHAGAAWAALDAPRLEAILGAKLAAQDGELKFSVPQTELKVVVDGFSITPAMGLTSWAAFSPHGKDAMVMGDLVLLEDEFRPVQRAVLDAGLSITAIHNHFLRDEPKVMFMHIGGMGEPEALARGVRQVFDRIAKSRGSKGLSKEPARIENALDPADLAAILGRTGESKDGVYKVVIGRPDVKLDDGGAPVSAFGGFNTWMAFQGTTETAAAAGDFAMLEGEVDGVIRALVDNGIEVTAVHNHMVGESPRVVFLHFWGVDTLTHLAKGLKAALDKTGPGKKP